MLREELYRNTSDRIAKTAFPSQQNDTRCLEKDLAATSKQRIVDEMQG